MSDKMKPYFAEGQKVSAFDQDMNSFVNMDRSFNLGKVTWNISSGR